ncbi:GlxA family transcriptional regulator [Micromonospora sp. NPDC049497]|uniref:GlxA family transcriptional regulator n=1 Tax=Micromonospora sp. NPDC049497 TaxID=3364273 RepID=UPI0037B487B4
MSSSSHWPTSPKTVVVPIYDGVDLLDVAGPVEVFTVADRLTGGGRYEVLLAAAVPGRVNTLNRVQLVADRSLTELPSVIDTLLVPGGAEITARRVEPVVDSAVVAAVRTLARRARRVASVCTGAHVLAAAGVLDGRRATTHWATAATLRTDHPAVAVDADPVFVRDGKVWTSAGLSSGIDLALALVADDCGDDVARAVARWLVVYLRRPGGQAQYSAALARDATTPGPVHGLQRWIVEHLDEDLSVPALAARLSMSVRHFSRVFAREAGCTPAEYVAALRLEAARRHLEQGGQPLHVIARVCGYGSVDSLQRAFRAHGTTPARHRTQFGTASQPTVSDRSERRTTTAEEPAHA